MNRSKLMRRMAPAARDFLTGLLLFAGVAMSGLIDTAERGSGWLTTSAHARLFELEMLDGIVEAASIAPVAAAQPQGLAMAVLALAFASLFAVNLWFARHIRRAHASYRRRK